MVDWVLVKFDDIVEIQALKPEAAERIRELGFCVAL